MYQHLIFVYRKKIDKFIDYPRWKEKKDEKEKS